MLTKVLKFESSNGFIAQGPGPECNFMHESVTLHTTQDTGHVSVGISEELHRRSTCEIVHTNLIGHFS